MGEICEVHPKKYIYSVHTGECNFKRIHSSVVSTRHKKSRPFLNSIYHQLTSNTEESPQPLHKSHPQGLLTVFYPTLRGPLGSEGRLPPLEVPSEATPGDRTGAGAPGACAGPRLRPAPAGGRPGLSGIPHLRRPEAAAEGGRRREGWGRPRGEKGQAPAVGKKGWMRREMTGTRHTGGCRAARGALGAGGRMLWGRDRGREVQESAGSYLGQDPVRPGREGAARPRAKAKQPAREGCGGLRPSSGHPPRREPAPWKPRRAGQRTPAAPGAGSELPGMRAGSSQGSSLPPLPALRAAPRLREVLQPPSATGLCARPGSRRPPSSAGLYASPCAPQTLALSTEASCSAFWETA